MHYENFKYIYIYIYIFEIHESALDSTNIKIFSVQILIILVLKIGKVRGIEFIDRDAFTVLTYFGFYHKIK